MSKTSPGCGVSEALALTADRIDVKDGAIVIESAKKAAGRVPTRAGSAGVSRYAEHGSQHSGGAEAPGSRQVGPAVGLEPDERMICGPGCDEAANIAGPNATPKGLRHGFGIIAVTCGVPLNTLQQLFGHTQLSTSIYADAHGTGETPACGADVELTAAERSGTIEVAGEAWTATSSSPLYVPISRR